MDVPLIANCSGAGKKPKRERTRPLLTQHARHCRARGPQRDGVHGEGRYKFVYDLRAIERSQVRPEARISIEDSRHGLEAARAAGSAV